MSELKQSTFEGWAVVEIFGHQRYAGFVTTEAFGQAVLFRVDVPPLTERERVANSCEYDSKGQSIPPGSIVKEEAVPGYSKLFGPSAIYALTPCTQEAAEKALAAMQTRKLTLVTLAPERAIDAPHDSFAAYNDADPQDDAEAADEDEDDEDDAEAR
jgi:hypothetical protein